MVADEALNPITELLIRAWHDAEAIRDMPELFTEEKLAQIGADAMTAIEEVWKALGHSLRDLDDLYQRLMESGRLENWPGKEHVDLE